MRSSRRKFTRALGLAPISVSLLGSRSVQAQSKISEDGEITEAPAVKQTEIEAYLSSVLRNIPEKESERLALVNNTSIESCSLVNAPSLDLDEIGAETTITKNSMGALRNALTHINEVFEIELPVKYLDEFSRLTKFVPLLSSLQNYIGVCCKIDSLSGPGKIGDDLVEDFYIALGLVIVELILLPSSIGYRTSFMGTRYVANAGLVRTRQIVGLRGYSVLLSVVHWGLRGTIEGTTAYIVERTAETVRDVELEGVSKVKESDLDYEFLEQEESFLGKFLNEDEKSQFLDNWADPDEIEAPSVGTDTDGTENGDDGWFW